MTRRAFTLADSVAALLGLAALAALGCATAEAQRTEKSKAYNLDKLRLTMRDVASYCEAHDGAMPNFGLPDNPASAARYRSLTRFDDFQTLRAQEYTAIVTRWPSVLEEWLGRADDRWYSDSGPRASGMVGGHAPESEFRYSLTMVTAPTMWQWPGRTGVPWTDLQRNFEVVKRDRIAFPSRKGVFLFDRGDRRGYWLVAFADGAADERAVADGIPGAQVPWSERVLRGRAVLATINGYLGRDY